MTLRAMNTRNCGPADVEVTGIQALTLHWLTHRMPRMKDELPRWEAQTAEGPHRMHTLQAGGPSASCFSTGHQSAHAGQSCTLGAHMWTMCTHVPFWSEHQLSGFCGRLAGLMFTDNAHRDWSPKGDDQDSGTTPPQKKSVPQDLGCPHGSQNAGRLD